MSGDEPRKGKARVIGRRKAWGPTAGSELWADARSRHRAAWLPKGTAEVCGLVSWGFLGNRAFSLDAVFSFSRFSCA